MKEITAFRDFPESSFFFTGIGISETIKRPDAVFEGVLPLIIKRERDALAVGAFDKGKLIGLAGCSADCETMYRIGVEVLPAYICSARQIMHGIF